MFFTTLKTNKSITRLLKFLDSPCPNGYNRICEPFPKPMNPILRNKTMAKKHNNQMVVAGSRQMVSQQNPDVDVLALAQQAANNLMQQMPGGRFSNRMAIDTVCRAIAVNCNPNATDNEKKAAAMFATEVAVNSVTAGEEVENTIRQMQQAMIR